MPVTYTIFLKTAQTCISTVINIPTLSGSNNCFWPPLNRLKNLATSSKGSYYKVAKQNRIVYNFAFRVKLSEAHQHMDVFMYLDDTIIQHIELSEDPRLKEAQSYIRMLKLRQLYHVEKMAHDPVELVPASGRFQWKRRIQTPDEAMPGTVLYHNDNGDIVQKYSEFSFIFNNQP